MNTEKPGSARQNLKGVEEGLKQVARNKLRKRENSVS